MKKHIRKSWLLCLGTAFALGSMRDVNVWAETVEKLPDIRIGVDEYEPYNYLDENGELAGIDADLADEAFSRMGYTPLYVLMKWTEKDSYLEDNVIDCIWDSYSMNGREDDYLWSEPYMYSRECAVVNEDSSIRTLDELNNRKIATLGQTRAEEILLKKEVFPMLYPEAVYSLQYMDECLAALRQGYVDAAAGDKLYIERYLENYPGKLRIIKESLETSELAVAFAKDGDQELVKNLNKTLKEMKADGTIDKILEKYQAEDLTVEEKKFEN